MVALFPPAPVEPILLPPTDPTANRLEATLVELVGALGPPRPVGVAVARRSCRPCCCGAGCSSACCAVWPASAPSGGC